MKRTRRNLVISLASVICWFSHLFILAALGFAKMPLVDVSSSWPLRVADIILIGACFVMGLSIAHWIVQWWQRPAASSSPSL